MDSEGGNNNRNRVKRKNDIKEKVAAALLWLILVFMLFISFSCSPKMMPGTIQDTTEKETVSHKDSIAYRDTTLYIPIPLEKDQAIVHVGDTSRRETSLAVSEAWVDSTGFIHHNLENKAGHFRVVVSIPSYYIFNEVTKEKAEYLTKIEYCEKDLSWWQKFRIGSFWWLLGAVLLLLVWTFRKIIFRI